MKKPILCCWLHWTFPLVPTKFKLYRTISSLIWNHKNNGSKHVSKMLNTKFQLFLSKLITKSPNYTMFSHTIQIRPPQIFELHFPSSFKLHLPKLSNYISRNFLNYISHKLASTEMLHASTHLHTHALIHTHVFFSQSYLLNISKIMHTPYAT